MDKTLGGSESSLRHRGTIHGAQNQVAGFLLAAAGRQPLIEAELRQASVQEALTRTGQRHRQREVTNQLAALRYHPSDACPLQCQVNRLQRVALGT